MMKKNSKKIKKYLSLVKFSHTVFAMPFAIIGFFLATQYAHAETNWITFLFVILCMIFARNSAMAFNRYIDREIDLKNPRTAIREIPAGIIKPKSALRFVIINSILFFATTYFINTLAFHLSPLALFIILGYSITKKFTSLCHFFLGIGLSLAPIGAYIAVTNQFDLLPMLFSVTVLLWVSGFDIIYALQDEDFDKSEQLKSIPVLIGKKNALMLSSFLHIICALIVIYAGYYAGFKNWYWIGAGLFNGFLFYQHLIVKPNDLSKINLAFFTTNGIASIILAVFIILELFLNTI